MIFSWVTDSGVTRFGRACLGPHGRVGDPGRSEKMKLYDYKDSMRKRWRRGGVERFGTEAKLLPMFQGVLEGDFIDVFKVWAGGEASGEARDSQALFIFKKILYV